MKKLFYVFFAFIFGMSLVACGGKDKGKTPTPTPSGTTGEQIEYPNLMGKSFIIMCNDKNSCDPRTDGYERLFKREKIQKIQEVEKNYNVKIEYVSYPSEASWGGARERWLAEQATFGTKKAMVYELTSYELGIVVNSNSILEIGDYVEKYGVKGYWPEKMAYGQFQGKTYSYDDYYPIADEGIYYNIDLLKAFGYEEKDDFSGNTPAELWLRGEWTWDKFEEIVTDLNEQMDETDPVNPQWPMGGRTYNWAYQFIGSNGGHLVSNDLEVLLDSEENIETLNYLNKLYSQEGMWKDDAALSNASQVEFTAGNIAFHNGQSYWIFQDNKWKNRNFEIGFVPYPKGPKVLSGEKEYCINDVYGKTVYVFNPSFKAQNNIADKYDFHSETNFRIWADLQYFPEYDETTGKVGVEEVKESFLISRLEKHYQSYAGIEAHLSIIDKNYPDLFYASNNSNNHNESAYMIKIQACVQFGDVRQMMETIKDAVQADFEDLYGVKK